MSSHNLFIHNKLKQREPSPAIAFDLGNVLFGFDYTLALNKIKSQMKLSVEEVMHLIYVKDITLPFEKGLISAHEFYKEFIKKIGIILSYKEFVDIWCKIFYPNPDVIELVRNLRKRYSLYLISNINQLHFDYLYQDYQNVFTLFDDLVLSFQIKSVKPEKKIYQALQKAAGVNFPDIVYIDDRPDLISEAEKFNFKCIQFNNYSQLFRDLKTFGLVLG